MLGLNAAEEGLAAPDKRAVVSLEKLWSEEATSHKHGQRQEPDKGETF